MREAGVDISRFTSDDIRALRPRTSTSSSRAAAAASGAKLDRPTTSRLERRRPVEVHGLGARRPAGHRPARQLLRVAAGARQGARRAARGSRTADLGTGAAATEVRAFTTRCRRSRRRRPAVAIAQRRPSSRLQGARFCLLGRYCRSLPPASGLQLRTTRGRPFFGFLSFGARACSAARRADGEAATWRARWPRTHLSFCRRRDILAARQRSRCDVLRAPATRAWLRRLRASAALALSAGDVAAGTTIRAETPLSLCVGAARCHSGVEGGAGAAEGLTRAWAMASAKRTNARG